MLKEAVGLTESFCAVCGQWYPPGTHTCLTPREAPCEPKPQTRANESHK
jgi:hypothetical protein